MIHGSSPAGFLLVLALMLPAAAILPAFVRGGRHAERMALTVMPVNLALSVVIAALVLRSDGALVYVLGGWMPPLGLVLRADGLSAAMMLASSIVMLAIAFFARGEFGTGEGRAPFTFWVLLLALSCALNAVFLGSDLFNLYVAIELLTFAAVPLVCLDGSPGQLRAALRYLLFALLGSVLYLLGVALLYGAYGTLDIQLLAQRVAANPATLIAASLMTLGLFAKTALFPLHLWLPPAHAGAPAPASAVLSALVVKGSFFILLRLWFDAMPGLPGTLAAQLPALLGALAILFGSAVALRQARLKMLIAYSTVAQIGYLFLMFPLLVRADALGVGAAGAWTGGMLQAISHAMAKAAMFMAAGLIAKAAGHDEIGRFGGLARALPMTAIAFALGGFSLMGLPPSGGFVAKWLLLRASIDTGQWWWALVVAGGGMLTGGYVFKVLAATLSSSGAVLAPIPLQRQKIVLALAVGSVLLGVVPLASFGLVQVGRATTPEVLCLWDCGP